MSEFGSGKSRLTQAAKRVKTKRPITETAKPPKTAIFSVIHAFGPSFRLNGRSFIRRSLISVLILAILWGKTLDERALLCYDFLLIINSQLMTNLTWNKYNVTKKTCLAIMAVV